MWILSSQFRCFGYDEQQYKRLLKSLPRLNLFRILFFITHCICSCGVFTSSWSLRGLFFRKGMPEKFLIVIFTSHHIHGFLILNGCQYLNGLYIWKLFKCLKLFGEMRLNTLDRLLLLRLICMQDCYVHRLIYSCILQNLV